MNTSNILALALAGTVTMAAGQVQQKVGWSTGYYAGWAQGSYPPSRINWKSYTHMCHFSITPDGGSGAVKMDMGLSDGTVKAFVAEAKKYKVKAIICVGGAGTGGNFQKASETAALRANFIKNIIAFMQKYGYDGVDMDWEEIGGKEANYQLLHKELRVELDKITPRPLLTVAMANYIANACGPIHSVFDQMNNMTYWTPASRLNGDFSPLIAKGVPKSKMGVGIGFDYEENGNPEIDCSPEAVKSKCDYALANSYGGVMVWAIEKDFKKFNAEPSHDMLFKYVPLPGTTGLMAGPSFRGAEQEILSMTISGNGSMGQPVVRYLVPATEAFFGAVVNLGLYGTDGRAVKTLVSKRSGPGAHSIGLDGNGVKVNPGAYIVRISAGHVDGSAQTLVVK